MTDPPSKKRDSDYATAVAGLVREARRARGLSQADLAERLGIEPATLSRYEVGARAFPLALLARCAETLAIPAASLLPGTPPQPEAQRSDLLDAWSALDEDRRNLVIRLAQSLARR